MGQRIKNGRKDGNEKGQEVRRVEADIVCDRM